MVTFAVIVLAVVFAAGAGMSLFLFVGPLIAGRYTSGSDRRREHRHKYKRRLAGEGR